jgi:hypothetical protein
MIGRELYYFVSFLDDRESTLIVGHFLYKSVILYMFICYLRIEDTSDGVDFR